MKKMLMMKSKFVVLIIVILTSVSMMYGCSGDTGATGPAGPAGSNTGTVNGMVTAPDGKTALAGVTVSNNITTDTTTTDNDGKFSMALPIGTYTLSFAKNYFTTVTSSITIAAAGSTAPPVSVAMAESASGLPSVSVTADSNEVGFGNTISLKAIVTPGGNSTSFTYAWTGATAGSDPTTATATTPTMTKAFGGSTHKVTINGTDYSQLPAAYTASDGTIVPQDQNYIAPFVQEKRFGILPITADTRGTTTVSLKVTDSIGGAVTATPPVALYAAAIQPGVKDVAIGEPVYLNSGHADPSAWTLTAPAGSKAALSGAGIRNPFFVPDVVGTYTVAEGANSMVIYAGNFVGVITKGSYVSKTFNLNNPFDAGKSGMWYDSSSSSPYWPSGAVTYTFAQWPVVTPDPSCLACHGNNAVINGLTAPDTFTPWTQTAHATFFSRGLDNITSNGSTCLTCHTTGYDMSKSAVNGGFDDLQAFYGWVYPKKQFGNWGAIFTGSNDGYKKVMKLSNIQCENCHGPQDTGSQPAHISGLQGGTSGAKGGTRVDYSSEVCATCHASGTGHHFYSEWSVLNPDTNMGHSKIAQLDVTGYTGHARSTDVSCARCHTAEGFAAYVDQLATGNAGVLSSSDIVWTKDNAHPQTCTACHDPHSDDNPNQLRMYDSIQVTMAGFGVKGLGKGAICVTCHNIRNGVQCNLPLTSVGTCPSAGVQSGAPFLHEDNDPVAPSYMDTPHDNASGDVLMGRNAFFMTGLPMVSKHASVEDSCVGCHMANNPATHLSHGSPAVSSHNFFITDAQRPLLCGACHSSSVDGEALVTFVENSLNTLKDKMAADVKNRTTGKTIYVGSSHTAVAVSASTVVALPEDSTSFSFTNGSTKVSGGLSTITTDAAGTTLVFSPNDKLKKGLWNYILIFRDQSKGIHNPGFVTAVLNNTIAQF